MQTASRTRPGGLVAFVIVWLGQIISMIATNMSQFALTIWAYEQTGSATALALVQVFFITPFLLFSPFAGAMVDRYNRKLMMMVSDVGAGVATILIFTLYSLGRLEIWHLYLAAAITGTFNCFQWPAYSASISLMVPREQLGRVNGLMSLLEMGPGVVAPLLAGALFGVIGLGGILTSDIVTFIVAVLALLAVYVPQPPQTEEGRAGQGNMLREAAYGFQYIFARPSLLGLQIVFLFGNLLTGIGFVVVAPMILARTGNDSVVFGLTQTAGAIGGVTGGLLMSVWGGFRRRVNGVLIGWALSGVLGLTLLGLGRATWAWAAAMFLGALVIPLTNASNQAIWQATVAPDVQGRVFSARRLIAWVTNPISPLIGGALADFVLEPAMRTPSSSLAATFGWLVGTGPGAGMALLLVVMGLVASLVGVLGYFVPAVRHAEDRLPVHPAAVDAP
ncbi:MAG: MFS transporter [Anaerolineae bacterium]|nr:MFS transporter [Anaerolineae bacterium]